jgi:hypothetical protein
MTDDTFKFPIYVVRKGSTDLERLPDSIQLEAWVVKREVQNNLYLAWDYYGRPLKISWDQKRLECVPAAEDSVGSLAQFLRVAGTKWEIEAGELNDEIDLELAYNRLKTEQKAAIKDFNAKSKKFKGLAAP